MTSQNASGAPGSATIDGTFLHARDRGANRIRVGEATDRQFDLVAEEAAGLVCIADEGADLATLLQQRVDDHELTLFSYEIPGLVGSASAGPHDLGGMVRRGRMLDWAGETRYYVEPKRLAALGYLKSRKTPGKTRDRTVYTLTDKGIQALREWARTPVRFTPVKSEVLLRELDPKRSDGPATPRQT
jgi:hypothetical protein